MKNDRHNLGSVSTPRRGPLPDCKSCTKVMRLSCEASAEYCHTCTFRYSIEANSQLLFLAHETITLRIGSLVVSYTTKSMPPRIGTRNPDGSILLLAYDLAELLDLQHEERQKWIFAKEVRDALYEEKGISG